VFRGLFWCLGFRLRDRVLVFFGSIPRSLVPCRVGEWGSSSKIGGGPGFCSGAGPRGGQKRAGPGSMVEMEFARRVEDGDRLG